MLQDHNTETYFRKYKIVHTHDGFDGHQYVAQHIGSDVCIEDALAYLQFVAAEEWEAEQELDNSSIILGLTTLYGFVECSPSKEAELVDIFYCWERNDNPVEYPPSEHIVEGNPLYRPKEDVLAVFYPYVVLGKKYQEQHAWVFEDRPEGAVSPWVTAEQIENSRINEVAALEQNKIYESFDLKKGHSYRIKVKDNNYPTFNTDGSEDGGNEIVVGRTFKAKVISEFDDSGFVALEDVSTQNQFKFHLGTLALVQEI